MLGLILIYFVGKAFYELAGLHDKSQWLYAVLGVGSYYLGIILTGFLLGILLELGALLFLADLDEMILGFICIPFGVLSCWGLYSFWKKSWAKESSVGSSDLLDN